MKKFIEDNNITFNEGERNSSVTICIGYAQSLGLTKQQLKDELSVQIIEDNFIGEEIERIWDFCNIRNYKNYWKSKEAKEIYTF